jgi:glycosyltransferase involved in cell wall biosynthesis
LTDLLTQAGANVRNFPLQRFRRTWNPFRLMSYADNALCVARRIEKEWNEPCPEIIHSNSTTAHIYGAILAWYWRVPCVWHVRDLVPLGILGRVLYAGADAVIATSNAVADIVRRTGVTDEKLHVIPNGIRLDAPPDAGPASSVRVELSIPESAPLLAIVGQLVPWKRHDVFLRAFATTVRLWPQAVGLIVGDDLFGDNAAYKAELLDLTRQLRLEKNVRFLGWRQDIPAILHASDLVVVPSQAEPFGRVALEAMAAGRPVIGTRAGGLPDIVADGQTGRLVPPGDPTALAKAIQDTLWNRKLAQQMGEAGRKRVAELFDIRSTTQSVEQLYDLLLARPSRTTQRRA